MGCVAVGALVGDDNLQALLGDRSRVSPARRAKVVEKAHDSAPKEASEETLLLFPQEAVGSVFP